MRDSFDRRLVGTAILDFIRACQQRVACHLGGGVALSGAYLGHRLTGDVDLFAHQAGEMRLLVGALPEIAARLGMRIGVVRDVGHLVRVRVETGDGETAVDLVDDPVADVEPPPPPLEGVVVESLADLRANKLTCILSRSEPRDLVDLCFLDRAGYPPERDLELASRKDAGIDPLVLAWLLSQFPTRPLPEMLEPLSEEGLREFRDELMDRLRRVAIATDEPRALRP